MRRIFGTTLVGILAVWSLQAELSAQTQRTWGARSTRRTSLWSQYDTIPTTRIDASSSNLAADPYEQRQPETVPIPLETEPADQGMGSNASAAVGHAYDDPLLCDAPAACVWFGSVSGLVMTRDRQKHFYFSYDDTNEAVQLLDVRDAEMPWSGGSEVHFGRYFHCGRFAIEGVYWGLYPDTQEATMLGGPLGGNLNGISNWDNLDYNGGTADASVNAASAQRLQREFQVHNVEINLLGTTGFGAAGVGPGGYDVPYAGCDSAWRFGWGTGVRYFLFDESLQFAADTVDTVFTGDPNEIYYDVETKNHLIGWQVAGQAVWDVWPQFGLLAGAKLGIYGNHIQHYSRIGGGAGDAVVNNGPNAGQPFRFSGSKNDVSFLAELNAGAQYRVSPHWSATIGYRAVAVTGVAIATDQIPADLRGVNDLGLISSDGSLILHGGYAGLTFFY